MNSRGIQLSGVMGREMANLVLTGNTSVDMFSYNINRFQRSYIGRDDWREQGKQTKPINEHLWEPEVTIFKALMRRK